MSTVTLITAEEFARMSFDTPVELLCGEIVEMTRPGQRHGTVCVRTGAILVRWEETQPERWNITSNDAGVILSRGPDTVRGPDLYVARISRLPGGQISNGVLTIPPDVAVEVVSPSDRWPAVVEKVGQFLRAGVAEVWVLNPEHRRLHLYRIDDEPTVLSADGTLHSRVLPGFECPVAEFFRGA